MKNNGFLIIRRIFRMLLSVSVLLSGICLIAGCLSIWFLKDGEYTRALVEETLSSVAVPLCVNLVLIVIGFILEFAIPSEPKKEKNPPNNSHLLARLTETRSIPEPELESVLKERKRRKNRTVISVALLGVAGVVFAVYALIPSNYTGDINASVISAVKLLVPCLAIPFAFAVYSAYSNEKSLIREIEIIKKMPRCEKKPSDKEDSSKNGKNALNAIRLSLLFVALAVCFYGYFSGGFNDVLTKAVNICTECIGLG